MILKTPRPVKKDKLKADPVKAAAINKPEIQEKVTSVEETGTPIDDLEKRLSLLK